MAVPGSTSSALDLIKGAMRNLNIYATGEEPSADEAQDALVILNQMIDTWNGEGLMIFTTVITDFPLTSSKQIYTLGTGGDFNIARPAEIDRASIVILSNPQQPLEYPIPVYSTQDWQEKVPIKNVPGNLPLLIYDDGGFPLRTLTFWPVASDSTLFRLYSWQQLTQFNDLQQVASYPPGYMEALRYNLAIRLAPEFQKSVPPETAVLAMNAMAKIKTSNADDTQLRSDLSSSSTSSRMRSELFNIP
ncbi:MAG: hypothetical protein JWQ87_2248 [Candidatus Sulfotelmatobacter sp.]|nr:hypothetical protein [Candidatus Sulfotelmatobacter sp.]